MANKHLKKPDTSPQAETAPQKARHAKQPESPKKAGDKRPDKGKKTAKGKKDPKRDTAQEQVISLTDALTSQVEASLNQSKAQPAGAADAPGEKVPSKAKAGPKTKAASGEKVPSKAKAASKAKARTESGTRAASGTKAAPAEEATSEKKAPKPKHTVSRRSRAPASKEKADPAQKAEDGAAGRHDAAREEKKPVNFHRDKAKPVPGGKKPLLSHRDRVGAVISLIAAVVLLAATAVVWVYKDSFSPDGMVFSADTAAVAREEYVFDAGSGEAFAAAGKGLAVANTSGFELLDGDGTAVTSMVMQMENPAATGCDSFAVFYDLGGRRLAVARFDGTVEEIDTEGSILSATVSEGGYLAITTEHTGYRALVTVYDPDLEEIYEWYSSSAWVISATVSPDGRKLAVLSYTASGSEVRFFRLNDEDQTGSFAAEGTVLLDVHWFTSNKLCALSSEQVLFFSADGEWENTYSFNGQYLVGYTFDGSNCAAFALSPYRAGTTATLVSLDPNGEELGTSDIQSEIVCLTASDLEVMVLCSDGATLYNSSLDEKGRLNGLPGFKYGLLRNRGEALLIASNYAEVYTF